MNKLVEKNCDNWQMLAMSCCRKRNLLPATLLHLRFTYDILNYTNTNNLIFNKDTRYPEQILDMIFNTNINCVKLTNNSWCRWKTRSYLCNNETTNDGWGREVFNNADNMWSSTDWVKIIFWRILKKCRNNSWRKYTN